MLSHRPDHHKNGILGTCLYICVCGENGNLVAAEIFKLISLHCSGVIIGAMAHKITIVSIVCPTVCSDADQIKHQSSASLAFVRGIHRWSVDYPHKWQVNRKMFPFDDVIVQWFLSFFFNIFNIHLNIIPVGPIDDMWSHHLSASCLKKARASNIFTFTSKRTC